MGSYDDYKALVNEYTDDGGYTKKLMIYLESGTTGRGYSSYPSDVEYCTDGTIEIGGYFLDDRDENNKRLIYYRIKDNNTAQKVEITFTPVSSGGNIPSLDGYATQEWVSAQGYLTEHQSLAGYATESWVESKGYITSIPDTFATKDWVSSQGYLTEHQDLSSYALKSEIPSLDGYATQSWVQSQNYLTSHQNLSSYATKSWATSQFFEESKIWTGTQSAWDALTSSQKASYTIALITE